MLEISLNVSETHPWAPTLSDLHRLQCYNRAMIRWMCGVTTKDQVSSQDLFERMQFDDLAKVLLTRRLRWHGHIEHSDGLAEEVQKLNPIGGRGRHRPKKIWTEVIDVDRIASLCNHVTLYGLASPRLLHSPIDHIKTFHSFKHRYNNGR